jgi:hypothetical protein
MINTVQLGEAQAAVFNCLRDLRPLATMAHRRLVIIALGRLHPDGSTVEYLTLTQAQATVHLRTAIEIHETARGSVSELVAITGQQPVLLFEGDTLVGGKQNRVVNVTILLKAAATTSIPVSCLEHGRWNSGRTFAVSRKLDPALRSAMSRQVGEDVGREHARPSPPDDERVAPRYRADQFAVWQEIGHRQERAGNSSPTAALHDLYAAEGGDVEEYRRAFSYPEGAVGVAVAVGGTVTGLDVFDSPATLRDQWDRLVEAAGSAVLDHERAVAAGFAPPAAHPYPDDGAVTRMLRRAEDAMADAQAIPSVGEGLDVRFSGRRVHGSALVHAGRVVHAALFRHED